MWERKRGRLGLHTKSFKSSEALGAVMCRAVNWSWHSTVEKKEPRTYKRVKGTKDEAVNAGPERKGTHTDRIISTSSLKSGSGAYVLGVFMLTHTHMCAFIYVKVPLYPTYREPSEFLDSCTVMCSPYPPLTFRSWIWVHSQTLGCARRIRYTHWNHPFYWIAIFSRLNTPFLWSEFLCPRACKYYAHNLEILKAECCKDIWVNPLFAFYCIFFRTVAHWIVTIWINLVGFSNISKWPKKVNLPVKY